MVKRTLSRTQQLVKLLSCTVGSSSRASVFVTLLLLTTLVVSCSSCSTARRGGGSLPSRHELPFEGASRPRLNARQIWHQELEGKLTDLAVASESGHVLITQVLEGRGTHAAVLSLRDHSGKLLWKTSLSSPVRSQAISSQGDRIVLTTYEDELIRVDARTGKHLWVVTEAGMCRPQILEKTKQILCHHDDDSTPGVAFTVFDLNGKQKQRFKVPHDLLVLKIARDESRIALGMVKGRIWVLDKNFRKIFERSLEGEIVDLAVSSGRPAKLAALVNLSGVGQKLVALTLSAREHTEQSLDAPRQQVEISEDGTAVAVYGNGPRGQFTCLYSLGDSLGDSLDDRLNGSTPKDSRFQTLWSYRSPRYADYNQRIELSGPSAEATVLGFEEVTERTRHSHVVAIHRSGVTDWDIPVLSEEGAYLYARGFAAKMKMLVLGTDDGNLSAYEIRP